MSETRGERESYSCELYVKVSIQRGKARQIRLRYLQWQHCIGTYMSWPSSCRRTRVSTGESKNGRIHFFYFFERREEKLNEGQRSGTSSVVYLPNGGRDVIWGIQHTPSLQQFFESLSRDGNVTQRCYMRYSAYWPSLCWRTR